MAIAAAKKSFSQTARRGQCRPHDAEAVELLQGAGARGLSRHALDPPLRGKGRPALRHGLHRRLLPSLHRPGSRRHRHADGADPGRPGDHRLPRPRPHAGLRHEPARRDGRADRTPRRLFAWQGRLHAHVLQGEAFLRRPRHRRRAGVARHRAGLRQPLPRATRTSRSPISATARPTRARSTRASTWRRCGSCRSSTSSRTTATPWARRWRARRPRPISRIAACRSGFPACRSTAWTCAP